MPLSIASTWVEALPWAEACLVGVAFACGASLGSFLNVIAHRIPRGESPVTGGSHCPACGRAILARDNVPVLGWLLLRGRCRACSAAISRRYVLVEATCGVLLATLAVARLACDRHGVDRLLMQGDLRPLLVFAGQGAVLMTLMAWSLLAERGHRVTTVTRCLTMALALGCRVLVAVLDPAAVQAGGSPWPWLQPVLTSLAGGGFGWMAGCLIQRRRANAGISTQDGDLLALVGLAIGWPGVVPVAAVVATLDGVARGPSWAQYGTPPAALLVMVVCARWVDAAGRFWGWLR